MWSVNVNTRKEIFWCLCVPSPFLTVETGLVRDEGDERFPDVIPEVSKVERVFFWQICILNSTKKKVSTRA